MIAWMLYAAVIGALVTGLITASTIAVIFGVVMVGYQFMMFRELSATRRRR